MEIPRFIDEKLTILGAQKFYYRGEADEAKGLMLVVNPWLEGIQVAMRKQFEAIKYLTLDQVKELQKECTDPCAQPEPKKIVKKVKTLNNTFYAKLESLTLLNADALKTYPNLTRPVHQVNLRFSRSILSEQIEVGQSLALFGQNDIVEVMAVIKAFGWKEDQKLVGYKTVKSMLMDEVDIRTLNVNLEKIFKDMKEHKDTVATFKNKY